MPITTAASTPITRRLLVVDDEPFIRNVLARFFTSKGWEVEGASDRASADEALDRGGFSAVLLDLGLGGPTDGLDLIDRTRATCPEAAVVILTGRDLDELRQTALERGADAFVGKPPDLGKLVSTVSSLARERALTADVAGC